MNARLFDDGVIDLPVNNLGLLIRRFNTPDRELILNTRGRKQPKQLRRKQQRLRDAMKLEP